ncbi:MAG: hypothetical protein JWQ76_1850 [Ramlibacter sp.]|nr:hypothetical protein [Ramlibacter sp.]
MKFDITQRMSEVNDLMKRTDNPLHWSILNNYVRHAILELCNEWRLIVAPEMMVPHPVYRFHEPTGLKLLDGMEAVCAEYESYAKRGIAVIYHTEGRVEVGDYGFITEFKQHRFWPGSELRKMGDDVDDPEATYLVTLTQMMCWLYDDQARLIEERVYRGRDRIVAKCRPEEVVSSQECRDKLMPLLPPVATPANASQLRK